jgi:hypothetical protein
VRDAHIGMMIYLARAERDDLQAHAQRCLEMISVKKGDIQRGKHFRSKID